MEIIEEEQQLKLESESPAPKKLKMSTSSSGGENSAAVQESGGPVRIPRPKRRKIALFLAYCGVGYQGMQRNPGAKTVEGELELALVKAGAIAEADYGDPRKVDWMRSARTDKGVSAVGQVVSGRFFIDPPVFIERLNLYLPSQIVALGFKRVTASFNAKKFCDRRRYIYLLPVFALDPTVHCTRESVIASEGTEQVLVKCVVCSERGRKVFGAVGRKPKGENLQNGTAVSGDSVDLLQNSEQGGSVMEVEADLEKNLENGSAVNGGSVKLDENLVFEESLDSIGEGVPFLGKDLQNGLVSVGVCMDLDRNEEDRRNSVNIIEQCANSLLSPVVSESLENRIVTNVSDATISVCDEHTESGASVVEELTKDGDSGDFVNSNTVRTYDEQSGIPELTQNKDVVVLGEVTEDHGSRQSFDESIMGEGENGSSGSAIHKVEESKEVSDVIDMEKQSGFSYGEKERERFNSILKQYVGTHNFHNLTTRTKAEDPSAFRYIISFEANEVVTVDNIDFVKCVVIGQSFMLHQIRKMIGLAVAIMRGCAPDSIMSKALRKDVRINVPTAPELGLFLDECLYTSYNQKWRETHEELSLKQYADEIEEFKMKHIYGHIASTEHKEGVVALWLHSLNHRNYPDFNVEPNVNANGNNAVDADPSEIAEA